MRGSFTFYSTSVNHDYVVVFIFFIFFVSRPEHQHYTICMNS